MRRLNLLYLAGLVVVAMCMAKPSPALAALYGDYLSSISAGSLNQPAKVAVDQANGDVYVTDAGNKLVKKYDMNGNYVATFSLSVAGTPVGIAVNAGNIFVGDDTNDCVWIYDKSGALADLSGTGTSHKLGGASGAAVKMPNTVVVAPSGHIFVADGDNDKVLIYNADGTYNSFFGGSGTLSLNFYYPSGLAFGVSSPNTPSAGLTTQYFYVGDQGNYRVQKLHYVYDSTTKAITTAPAFDQNVGLTPGTRGDAFGSFLRISDLACDNTGRLIVLDSLQMVGQIFQSDNLYTSASNPCKDATGNVALNYCTSAVVGNLNVPTGAAVDLANKKIYVASNQSDSIAVYNTQDGAVPALTITDPSAAVVPCTATYTVNFSGTDADSTSETVKLYYYNTASPAVKTLFSTQSVTVTGGAFSGTATLDLVGTFPNFVMAGTYGVYGEVTDEKNNLGTADSGPAGTVGITNVPGEGNYTCSMAAKWGDGLTTDTDGDGLFNADELNGTHNTSYGNAATDPTNVDSDGDGLDDGVEEGIKPINQNIPIPFTSASTLATPTNPNAKDTDGGGVSDAVEVAKGTNPTVMGDDTTSETDITCAYFMDGASNWESILGFLNASPSPLVADLIFYKLDGSIAATAQAVKFGNNASMKISPSSYGATEGSIEIRTTQGPALAGFRASYLQNINGGGVYDTGFGSSLAYSPATHVYVPYMDSGAWRFQGFANLKNVTNGTINVTATYSLTVNGAGASLNPPTVTTKSYTLLPHETKHLDPAVEDAAGEVIISFDSNTPKSLVGTYYMNRYNANNATFWDYGQEEPMGVSPSTVSYCALFDSAAWRFKTWYSVMSPAFNTAPANANLSFNLTTSGANLSNLLGFYTKNLAPVNPGSYYAQVPEKDMLTPDATRTPTPTGAIPNPNGGEAAYKLTSDVPVFADSVSFRSNATTPSVYDYGFAVPNATATSSQLFVGYFDDSDTNRYKSWIDIGNPSETATVNVKAYFYDPNGNLLPATLPPNQNPYIVTIGPRGSLGFAPRNAGLDANSRIGSAKLVATDASDPTGNTPGQIFGYLMAQKWNIGGNQNLYDYSYAYNLQAIPYPPAPVQLLVTSVTSTQVNLGWEANPSFNLAGYDVYRSTTSGSGYVKINAATVVGTTYSDTTVITGTTYYYVLKAVDNSANISGNSGEVIAKP